MLVGLKNLVAYILDTPYCTHRIVSMILEKSHCRPTFTVTSLSNNKMSSQHGMIYFWTKIHLPPGPFLCLFNAAIVNISWPHSQGQLYSIECLIRRWLRKAEITKQQECQHIRLRGWGLAVFYLASRPGLQTLPDEAPPVSKIYLFSKIAVTFEPIQRFGCPSGFRNSIQFVL